MAVMTFGTMLRNAREERGWSLRDLGERICFHRGYVGKVETGARFPDLRFAELVDAALEAHGRILEGYDVEATRRKEAAKFGRILSVSVADSLTLLGADEAPGLNTLLQESESLPIEYLSSPPGPMLLRAVEVRNAFVTRMRAHEFRESESRDLHRGLALVQGVLTYAALDLGEPSGALAHAELAWRLADRIDNNELKIWIRGTQSLVARFESDYHTAQRLVENGLALEAPGTGRLRLLAGLAQSRANLGDSVGANAALDLAQREREVLHTYDSSRGLFEFSRAKQHYYAGSSLMWLPDPADSKRSAREAALAIKMWQGEPAASRSLDDEALAHIYQATALVHLGDLDAAAEAVSPVLTLPEERQISWIRKRLVGLAAQLEEPPYFDSREGQALRESLLSSAEG